MGRCESSSCYSWEASDMSAALDAGSKQPEEDTSQRCESCSSQTRRYGDGVFGSRWRLTWTPEEDALVRGMRSIRRASAWTHLGAALNFELTGEEYFGDSPLGAEHEALDPEEVAMFHF